VRAVREEDFTLLLYSLSPRCAVKKKRFFFCNDPENFIPTDFCFSFFPEGGSGC
jgi:hypothetical protein